MSENAIYDRRSIRKYQDREVPTEYIEQLIDAARMAPSAKNRQPWKYIVYTGDGKQKLTDAMAKGIEREESVEAKFPDFRYGIADSKNTVRVMREAPVVIVVLNTNGKSPFIPVKDDGRIVEQCDALSIGASIQNMLLRAQELGLGTLWIANTCFAYPELETYINTTDQIISAVAVGYSDEAPGQRPRKKIEEIMVKTSFSC
ncbi:MAG: nitroreductase family protein [Lachnospiraceae bacterium]